MPEFDSRFPKNAYQTGHARQPANAGGIHMISVGVSLFEKEGQLSRIVDLMKSEIASYACIAH